jgi:ferredoxin
MPKKIGEDCIECGLCEPECPNEAITAGDGTYQVDPDRCTECVGFSESPQCAEVCPIDGIQPDPKHQESQDELMARAVKLHPERFPRD